MPSYPFGWGKRRRAGRPAAATGRGKGEQVETATAVLGLGTLGFLLVTFGMLAVLLAGGLAAPTLAVAAWLGGRRRRLAYARVAARTATERVAR